MKHDNKEALNLLKTAKGQIEAVIKMTEEQRYCVDISNQVMAVQALLKKANLNILKNHIESCVRDSFEDGTHEEKMNEVIDVLKIYLK
ncbi:metal-sensing transcriptional repressor [Peloplasma aerotolerans]|jgi:CsoR family transcriptional regulator, copper-sensing transcriptional repressor|uniref:Copper-sensing transcriptional repressor CsoR n=1 Tax=Peloplasma aerotolerans TaxID=3044389 RepID=A0AAW6UAW5_9MOLU|nr:metal-sensing transcriptional repressor [Mariniplasma sp. M4Ah]MDI6453318.1 metal-sensing transcriptional repressor [Mariniplasma sp. M4Ah]